MAPTSVPFSPSVFAGIALQADTTVYPLGQPGSPGHGLQVEQIKVARVEKKGYDLAGLSLTYFNINDEDKYLPVNVPDKASYLRLELYCDQTATTSPITTSQSGGFNGEYYRYTIQLSTAAGCPVFQAKKDAYWMFGRMPLRVVLFFVTLFTGITIAIGGKFIWKFTHFTTGFGLLLTLFMIIHELGALDLLPPDSHLQHCLWLLPHPLP
jgi:hypothetical protein